MHTLWRTFKPFLIFQWNVVITLKIRLYFQCMVPWNDVNIPYLFPFSNFFVFILHHKEHRILVPYHKSRIQTLLSEKIDFNREKWFGTFGDRSGKDSVYRVFKFNKFLSFVHKTPLNNVYKWHITEECFKGNVLIKTEGKMSLISSSCCYHSL